MRGELFQGGPFTQITAGDYHACALTPAGDATCWGNNPTGNAPPPTAIICSNVRLAHGVYQALAALGLSIPGDVSVVAHDDHLPSLRASAFFPALTVTKAPLRDSWAPLADCLAAAIEGKPLAGLQKTGGYTFIERNSVRSI